MDSDFQSPNNVIAGPLTLTDTSGNKFTITSLNNGNWVIADGTGNNLIFAQADGFTVTSNGLLSRYNTIATAGNGVSSIYGATLQKSETAADPNVLTYTPPATAGQYRVSVSVYVTVWAANQFIKVAWKDPTGTAQNLSIVLRDMTAGTSSGTIGATGVYTGDAVIDIDNSATNIVVASTNGVGNTYKISAAIEQYQ